MAISRTAHATSRRGLLVLTGIGSLSLLAACADDRSTPAAQQPSPSSKDADDGADPKRVTMTVYKDESCGCCGGWVEHAESDGVTVTTEHPPALAEVWQRHDIPLDLQSCHLALDEEDHVFVGHVPMRFVHEYRADPPRGSRGLSVPAMPVGTPGMEQGEQFDPYEVMLLTDGEPEVFARVTKASQQRA